MSRKHRKTPLDKWRIRYNYMAMGLRDLKRRIKTGADWGTFRAGKQQAMLEQAKNMARFQMEMRGVYAEETRRDWEVRQAARTEAIAKGMGHNSKETE